MIQINEFLFDKNVRKYKFKRYSYKKKTLEKYVKKLENYKIGMGDWSSSNNTCISGAKVPNKKFVQLLQQKNPDMCFIDEFNTSKKCANCFEDLKRYDPEKESALESFKYSKLRHCQFCLEHKNHTMRPNNQHKHVIHRDQNGSRNITMLLELQLNGQKRPSEFERGNNDFDCKFQNKYFLKILYL